MPDYEIRCWDGNSFDFGSVPFVKEAMSANKFAFAADYIRLYALFTQGGIYLDSDVFVYKTFDPIITNEFFCGTEAYYADEILKYRMEAAIMGSEKGHSFVKRSMEWYLNKHFSSDSATSFLVMPEVISNIAQSIGYCRENETQYLEEGVVVFPTTIFTNALHSDFSNQDTLLAIHQNAGSWIDYSRRGCLFNFCRKHDMMQSYSMLEKILLRKKQ